MHQPPTPPPLVAPPVVPPPLPESDCPPPSSNEPSPSIGQGRRWSRDLQFGAVCIVAGLALGQTGIFSAREEAVLAEKTKLQASSDLGVTSVAVTPNADVERVSLQTFQSIVEQVAAERNDDAELPISDQLESLAIDHDHLDLDQGDPSMIAESITSSQESPDSPESPLVESDSDDSAPQIAEASPDANPPRSLFGETDESSVASLIRMNSPSTSLLHEKPEVDVCSGMDSHGTVLKWADSPADAYRLAAESDKLVFLIHVSGNFEIPGFT